MEESLQQSISDAIRAVELLKTTAAQEFILETASAIVQCYSHQGKLLIAGNGGSLCDAMHFAEEMTGQFRRPRRALPAIALADSGHMSCVANDFGFEEVFSRHVEALGRAEDIFIGLTTSGNSPNLIRAFEKAKERKMTTVAFLGKTGGALKGFSDHEWIVEGFSTSDRIQEVHMAAIHIIIEQVEKSLFPNLYEVGKVHEKVAKAST